MAVSLVHSEERSRLYAERTDGDSVCDPFTGLYPKIYKNKLLPSRKPTAQNFSIFTNSVPTSNLKTEVAGYHRPYGVTIRKKITRTLTAMKTTDLTMSACFNSCCQTNEAYAYKILMFSLLLIDILYHMYFSRKLQLQP
jgi:hypothetical protein